MKPVELKSLTAKDLTSVGRLLITVGGEDFAVVGIIPAVQFHSMRTGIASPNQIDLVVEVQRDIANPLQVVLAALEYLGFNAHVSAFIEHRLDPAVAN